MNEASAATHAPIALDQCPIAQTVALIGDRWTLLILREAFYGVRRFAVMQDDLGIPRAVLSHRLATLVEYELMHREPYHDPGQRTRYEYRLTSKGRALLPTLMALMQWGNQYSMPDQAPPLTLVHVDCGAEVSTGFVCRHGHALTHAREMRMQMRDPE